MRSFNGSLLVVMIRFIPACAVVAFGIVATASGASNCDTALSNKYNQAYLTLIEQALRDRTLSLEDIEELIANDQKINPFAGKTLNIKTKSLNDFFERVVKSGKLNRAILIPQLQGLTSKHKIAQEQKTAVAETKKVIIQPHVTDIIDHTDGTIDSNKSLKVIYRGNIPGIILDQNLDTFIYYNFDTTGHLVKDTSTTNDTFGRYIYKISDENSYNSAPSQINYFSYGSVVDSRSSLKQFYYKTKQFDEHHNSVETRSFDLGTHWHDEFISEAVTEFEGDKSYDGLIATNTTEGTTYNLIDLKTSGRKSIVTNDKIIKWCGVVDIRGTRTLIALDAQNVYYIRLDDFTYTTKDLRNILSNWEIKSGDIVIDDGITKLLITSNKKVIWLDLTSQIAIGKNVNFPGIYNWNLKRITWPNGKTKFLYSYAAQDTNEMHMHFLDPRTPNEATSLTTKYTRPNLVMLIEINGRMYISEIHPNQDGTVAIVGLHDIENLSSTETQVITMQPNEHISAAKPLILRDGRRGMVVHTSKRRLIVIDFIKTVEQKEVAP